MPITKYQYDEVTGTIVAHEFAQETKTRLTTSAGKQLRKDGGYYHNFYDTRSECRKATESLLGNEVRAARVLLEEKRAAMRVFRANNPKQGR